MNRLSYLRAKEITLKYCGGGGGGVQKVNVSPICRQLKIIYVLDHF